MLVNTQQLAHFNCCCDSRIHKATLQVHRTLSVTSRTRRAVESSHRQRFQSQPRGWVQCCQAQTTLMVVHWSTLDRTLRDRRLVIDWRMGNARKEIEAVSKTVMNLKCWLVDSPVPLAVCHLLCSLSLTSVTLKSSAMFRWHCLLVIVIVSMPQQFDCSSYCCCCS